MIVEFCDEYDKTSEEGGGDMCVMCCNPKTYRQFLKTKEGKELLLSTACENVQTRNYYECKICVSEALKVFNAFTRQLKKREEVNELLQFLSIFPAAIVPPQFVSLVSKLKKICKKFKIERVPEEIARNDDNWWATMFEYDISYGSRILNEILEFSVDEYTLDYLVPAKKYFSDVIIFNVNKFENELI